ncbi:MAG: hypothetical protein JNL89_11415, partial [Rhodanobacteraceae bacterium]|nr:hypothetical protein [Rhodanobacteraceae bacterium]
QGNERNQGVGDLPQRLAQLRLGEWRAQLAQVCGLAAVDFGHDAREAVKVPRFSTDLALGGNRPKVVVTLYSADPSGVSDRP